MKKLIIIFGIIFLGVAGYFSYQYLSAVDWELQFADSTVIPIKGESMGKTMVEGRYKAYAISPKVNDIVAFRTSKQEFWMRFII